MARNGSGIYSVPNPILIGALRSSSTVNENFSEAGDAITDTVAADGQTPVTGQMRAANGSETTPSVTWGSDLNSGFRLSGADEMRWGGGGVDRFYIDANGKAWFLGAVAITGATAITGAVTGVTDPFVIAAFTSNGVAKRTGTNLWAPDGQKTQINCVMHNAGLVIPTILVRDIQVPFSCVINSWVIGGDTTGSIQFDIWKVAYASYPPTVANSIVASAPPSVTSATSNSSSTLTGWTTAITAGDCIRISVTSVSSFTKVTLALQVTRYG